MIVNGKDKKLSDTSTALPDLSGGVNYFLQKIKIGYVQKRQVNGYTQEVIVYNDYQATKQVKNMDLEILKEGERDWKWYTLHATPELVLNSDDVIVIDQVRYRVMSSLDFKEYGYVEYTVIEDYQNKVIS